MVKGQARATRELKSSSVLPVGAKFEAGDRTTKTIDHSNPLPLFKKKPGSTQSTTADMFKPADPNSLRPAGHQHKGKDLHTDPFAADRNQYIPPKKVLRQPVYAQPHATGQRHLPVPQHNQTKHQMISASGTIYNGGKVTTEKHYKTTFENEQPVKDYASMARFKPKGSATSSRSTGHVTSPTAQAPPSVPHKAGIKRNEKEADKKSLVGVLRMEEPKKARAFAYRPPWGTCNTPRTPPTNRTANAPNAALSPKPFAVEAQ